MLSNKSNPFSNMMKNGCKNKKKLMHFYRVPRVRDFNNGAQYTTSRKFFMSSFYLFAPVFSGIVFVDKPRDFDEGICFPNGGYHKNKRKAVFELS